MVHILVVDNDVSTVVTMKAVVEADKNFKADVAYSGKEALEKMKEADPYNLVLLDIMMPQISGMDVCKEMVKDGNLRKLPVILVSALPIQSQGFQDSTENFNELSVVKGVVEKPFKIEVLQAKINEVLGQ